MKSTVGKQMTRFGIIACLGILLAGCAQPPSALMEIHSAHYLNPDVDGNASPVVVTVYQLKSTFNFQQATYDQLSTNSGDVLGADLIDRSTIEVRPDSDDSVRQTLSPNTQFLGIVAAYRNIGGATWRQTVPVTNAPNEETVITLDLESEALTATVNGTENTRYSL